MFPVSSSGIKVLWYSTYQVRPFFCTFSQDPSCTLGSEKPWSCGLALPARETLKIIHSTLTHTFNIQVQSHNNRKSKLKWFFLSILYYNGPEHLTNYLGQVLPLIFCNNKWQFHLYEEVSLLNWSYWNWRTFKGDPNITNVSLTHSMRNKRTTMYVSLKYKMEWRWLSY